MCLGPVASAILTCNVDDSSILAFSAASRIRCMAMGSLDNSIPVYKINTRARNFFLNTLCSHQYYLNSYTITTIKLCTYPQPTPSPRQRTYLLLEFIDEIFDQHNIKIFTAEMRVAIRALDLEHTRLNLEDANIERTTAQVIHGYSLVAHIGVVETIC
ncbi:NAD-specific glutamate dehydrogenase-domain-containing protein [Endogone sp. FLAS-F59071]|nr:NAD-specific glutamate dehydrogenase-domain-containing protein [Endogone sp. FLAS-F59071]|eukprot:RUS17965.1 NAD-specific glutamate dehydrogenase-domain-containing protein [Endogone sp. FLAS-F59071]